MQTSTKRLARGFQSKKMKLHIYLQVMLIDGTNVKRRFSVKTEDAEQSIDKMKKQCKKQTQVVGNRATLPTTRTRTPSNGHLAI